MISIKWKRIYSNVTAKVCHRLLEEIIETDFGPLARPYLFHTENNMQQLKEAIMDIFYSGRHAEELSFPITLALISHHHNVGQCGY